MAEIDSDDRALALRLLTGDAEAFELVYRRHNAAMLRFCAGIVRSRDLAEEVVQDTWVAVLGRIDLFEGRGSLAGWIYTILINKARSRARREGRIVSFDDFGDGEGLAGAFDGRGHWRSMPELWEDLTPERHIAGRSVLQHVEAVIETLPPAQRAVLILRGQQELDASEVCALLDISEGNMRVLLHRARLTVRNALDQLNAAI
ncbi:RNA polymerase sigma factor [Rhizobium rosettiformans]|uniref:RNA polymerase sigma factor n=1 Tax=Rhizobium rosettiformans TaxID=1368430 RepID=UPI002867131F|nr:sigma-70 family RNA polymerase sigma factor [Rhizobium rosettiformans]MDR7028668.1 RNA polymerase sigma-70 factor (ECF subfamily) [Rhizobium rosettiformans]MDR7064050.1 RNA polymerase sigma-70 factor (ECF subfamily) [Rhizobium rosettiformans]